MKTTLALLTLTLLLVSCGKVPQYSHETASRCLDSLKSIGAENTKEWIALHDRMINNNADKFYIEVDTENKLTADGKLEMATLIDLSVRNILGSRAKLVRVKIVE